MGTVVAGCYRAVSCDSSLGGPGFPFPTGYARNLLSMPVPDSDSLPAAAALFADELGELFAAAGHELALVGGAGPGSSSSAGSPVIST